MKSSVALLMVACTLAAGVAVAAYPEKTSHIIAFDSGVTVRLQESFLENYAEEAAPIQYKSGAGAGSQVDNTPGDGHTLTVTNLPHIMLQPLRQNVGYASDDLADVRRLDHSPDSASVPAGSPYALKDLVAEAKKGPGTLTFSHRGTNTNPLARRRFDRVGTLVHGDPQFIKQMQNKGYAMIDVPLDRMDASMAGYGAIAKHMGTTRK